MSGPGFTTSVRVNARAPTYPSFSEDAGVHAAIHSKKSLTGSHWVFRSVVTARFGLS
jgi:hypothetical protein